MTVNHDCVLQCAKCTSYKMPNSSNKVLPLLCGCLCCNFSAVCRTRAVKKKKSFEQFLPVQQCYRTAKSPTLRFRLFQSRLPETEAGIFGELVAGVFYADLQAVPVYTYSNQSHCSDKPRRLIKVYIRTCVLSDPRWSRRSAEFCHSPRQLLSYSRL